MIDIEIIKQLLKTHNHDGINTQELENSGVSTKYKVGTGSRSSGDGTGDEVVTSIGFTPKAVIVLAASSANAGAGFSVGFSDGVTNGCVRNYYNGEWLHIVLSNLIAVYDSGGDQTIANIKSFDEDGFTMDFTEMDETINYTYLVIG